MCTARHLALQLGQFVRCEQGGQGVHHVAAVGAASSRRSAARSGVADGDAH